MYYSYYEFIEKLGLLETGMSKRLYQLYLDCIIDNKEKNN